MARIAFIGLGNMGLPMAVNLVKNKHDVRGFDLSKKALDSLAAAGGTVVGDVAEACRDADILLTMLPSGRHVSDVVVPDALKKLKPGALLVDSSTIDPATARRVAALAEEHGHAMIDAPVSGGTAGAQNAALTFIVGGSAQALERATPVLSCMGKNILHAGGNGAGQVAKICNNMLLAIHMIGTSEALNLGVAHGLDPKVLSAIMQKSSGRNWSLETYNPYPGVMEAAPASRRYQGGFAVELMAKDLALATEASLETRTASPLGGLAQSIFALWNGGGGRGLDFSSIIRFLDKQKES